MKVQMTPKYAEYERHKGEWFETDESPEDLYNMCPCCGSDIVEESE